MVVHYPRTVWKNSYAEHEVTGKTYNLKKKKKCTYQVLEPADSSADCSTDPSRKTAGCEIKIYIITGLKTIENYLKLSVLARKNVFQVFLNFLLSNSHWPIGPVGTITPLALHQIYWPRASGQRLISQCWPLFFVFKTGDAYWNQGLV